MRKVILAASFLITCSLTAFPQKDKVVRDAWWGRVESVNVTTREITLTSFGDGKTESFSGVLDEGFKVRLLDDSVKELSISEIPVGMNLRVFYKTKDEQAGGKKVKVNHIFGVFILGRDVFDKLRTFLNLPSQTAVSLKESDKLPASKPLNIYLMIQPPRTKDHLVKWLSKWNNEKANTFGAIEFVSNLAEADVSLVIYNREVEISGLKIFDDDEDLMVWPSVTVFLVAPVDGGLNVLWRYTPFASSPKSTSLMEHIEKEIEKRMKTRS